MNSPAASSTTSKATRIEAHPHVGSRGQGKQPIEQNRMLRDRLAKTSSQLHQAAWLIELLESLANARSLVEASSELVQQLSRQLRADRVVLAWANHQGKSQILAVSDCAHADPQTESMMQLQAAIEEASDQEGITSWPPLATPTAVDATQRRPLIHQQLAKTGAAITVPLMKDDFTFGSLTLIGSSRHLISEPVLPFVLAACPSIASVLRCVALGEPSMPRRILQWIFNQPVSRALAAGSLLIGLFVFAAIPIPYRIGCQTLVEPVTRSFCVAPHDGIVETTLVAPGDQIVANQPLARMDGKDVRWELAGLYAEQAHAAKKRDTQRANHEIAQALQSELEVKRLQAKIDLLKYRQSNLIISSPMAGMVLSGSMERRENLPVEQGQVLYEIAPLEEMRIEISVPNDQIGFIRNGQTIDLTFDGLGSESFAGTVHQIRPRSETRDQQNVFVIECELPNEDKRLRPGMTGHAKVITDQKPLAWIAFHRAYENLRTLMPW